MEIIHFDSSFLVASKIPPKNPFWKRDCWIVPLVSRHNWTARRNPCFEALCAPQQRQVPQPLPKMESFLLGVMARHQMAAAVVWDDGICKKISLSCFQFSKEVERENGCFLAFLDSRDSKSQNGFIVNWRTILPNGKVSCLLILGLLLKLWGTTYLVP